MVDTVRVLIQSDMGHNELNVPKEELPKVVETQLHNGRWVTLERKDGSTEILTNADTPPAKPPVAVGLKAPVDDEDDSKESTEDEGTGKDWEATLKGDTGTKAGKPSKPAVENRYENVTQAVVTSKVKGG